MSQLDTLISSAAKAMGVSIDDLRTIIEQGERKSYAAGEYLFHPTEPEPRR